jgi:hypothetical protein
MAIRGGFYIAARQIYDPINPAMCKIAPLTPDLKAIRWLIARDILDWSNTMRVCIMFGSYEGMTEIGIDRDCKYNLINMFRIRDSNFDRHSGYIDHIVFKPDHPLRGLEHIHLALCCMCYGHHDVADKLLIQVPEDGIHPAEYMYDVVSWGMSYHADKLFRPGPAPDIFLMLRKAVLYRNTPMVLWILRKNLCTKQDVLNTIDFVYTDSSVRDQCVREFQTSYASL